jgi:hypothetical protein
MKIRDEEMKKRIAKKIAGEAGMRNMPIGLILRAGKKLSGWRYCYFGKRCKVLVGGKEMHGMIVCDPRTSATIIKRQDGVVQRGGIYQVIR